MRIYKLIILTVLLFPFQLIARGPDAIDSLMQELSKSSSDSSKAELLCEIAKIYARKQDSEKCLDFANKALEISLKSDYYKGAAKAYNIKGNLFGLLADDSEMLDNFLKAENYYLRSSDNQKGLSETYLNIAGVYHRTGKDSTALLYMARSKKIAEKLKDSVSIAMLINAEAVIYSASGHYEKALEKLFEAGKIMDQLNYTQGLLNINLSLGLTYFELKNYEKALNYCKECLESAKTFNNMQYVSEALRCIIKTKLKKGDKNLKSEVDFLISVSTYADEHTIKAAAFSVIKSYFEQIGDFKKAYEFALQHQISTDSLYITEKSRQSDRIKAIVKLQDKEKETALLAAEQAQKDALIKSQTTTVYITFTAILLISILLYFQWRSNKRLIKAFSDLDLQKEEISIKNEQLSAVNATKDQLFAIVSHDLMSPVVALSNIIELLKMKALSPEEIPYLLNEAGKEVENTADFLRNLLLWAKSSMEGFSLKKEKLNVRELSERSLSHLYPQIVQKEIGFENKINPDYIVFADKDLLETVLRNLVSNALKFTDRNGKISLEASKEGDFLKISVIDNGRGIPEEIQKNLLSDQLFSSRGTENEKGSGIGLSLCKKFAEANGGKIGFKSQTGKGSEFWFTLSVVG